jgi:hypothetical protein
MNTTDESHKNCITTAWTKYITKRYNATKINSARPHPPTPHSESISSRFEIYKHKLQANVTAFQIVPSR